MNRIKILSFVLFLLSVGITFNTATAQQSERNVGLGVMVGDPTGLSFKSWISETNAIDGGLAWSFSGRDAVHIHADYLWHDFDILGDDVNEGELPVYYGVGGRLAIYEDGDDDDAVFGVRIPVGINYLFEESPIGLFLEVAPIINLIPDTDFDADAAVGIRFYLN